ncbi:MAG: phage holin family protein [Candidatus Obscuribacterales bacterium]
MEFLVRLALKALAFVFLLPMLGGIDFHGNFVAAICLAIVFSLMLWGVEVGAMALSAYLTVTTFGLALLVLIPMWLLGFWLLPAFALRLVSDLLPQYLTVAGWGPAILGGLLMMVVSLVTGGVTDSMRARERAV